MIHLDLDAKDIGKLVKAGRELSGVEALDKIRDIHFTSNGKLAFTQHFALSTAVEINLSVDGNGGLLIDIDRLSGSSLLELPLKPFRDKITAEIASSTSGILVKTGHSQLKLDLKKVIPLDLKIQKISIAENRLAMDIELD